MQLSINPIAKDVLKKINASGYEAYLVGGAVRDNILGLTSQDFDICTNMPLLEVRKLFPNFHLMKPSKHRITGIMRINGIDIEISEFKGTSLEEDLSHRDFTINAIAQDKYGNIIDYNNGLEDLKNKKVSLVKKDGSPLEENPIQILRAIRIAAKLNFNIDTNCSVKMQEHKSLLSTVAVERIYRELIQLLITDNPSQYIRENKEIIFEILPELAPTDGFKQHNNWHIYDVFEHTLIALENTEKNIFLRLAVLFHDIGKPSKFFTDEHGIGHFYGHPEKSKELFEQIANRLRMDKKTKKIVENLIEKHDMPLSTNPEKIYQFIKGYGIDFIRLLFALKRADNLAQNPVLTIEVLKELDNLEELYNGHILTISNLQINVSKITELGINKKKLRIVLDDVTKQVLSGVIPNTEEDLKKYVERKFK